MTSNELWKRVCGYNRFRIVQPSGHTMYEYAPSLEFVLNLVTWLPGTRIYKVGGKEPLYIVG